MRSSQRALTSQLSVPMVHSLTSIIIHTNDIYNVVKERCFTVVITYSDMCRQQSCSQRCKCIYMSQSHYCTLQQKDKG